MDLGPVSVSEGKRALLEFDGINWKAEVRLNGSLLGRIDGAFLRSSFDVTSLLEAEHNILEVKILRNANPGAVKEKTARWTGYNGGVLGKDSPTFLCSIGWDWLTTIRGRNIGIWDEVRLVEKGPVTVSDPMVASKVSEDGRASMTASVFVKGVSGQTEVVNLCGGDLAGLTAGLRIFGYRGNLISEQSVTLDSPDDSTTPLFEAHAPSGEPVYYLSLTLRDASDKLLSENFYALGAESGNLRALRSLPSANISYRISRDGDGLTVTLRNETDTPALLVRLILLDRNGEEILPVNYSDNYFSLMPGAGKTVRIEWGGDPSKAGIAITQLGDFQM